MTSNEDRRQFLHASMTAFALLLRWLTPWQAAALAGTAVVFNWAVLPRTELGRGLRREGGPFVDGVKLYPVAILAVVLLFRDNPVAAAAWGVLGIGDAASNLVGRRLGRPPFLGRSDRSAAGSIAFVLTGFPAAAALHAWAAPGATATVGAGGGPLLASAAAAVAGATAELLMPRGWDDNVAIALAAAGAFTLVV